MWTLKNKNNLYYLLESLFCFFLISCSSQETKESNYTISGTVYNYYNSGIANVKVYYTNDAYVITDNEGKFKILNAKGTLQIKPQDPAYIFSPNTITINTTTTENLSFYGAPVSSLNENATYVYHWMSQMQLPNGLLESTENSNIVSLYDNALAALVFIAKDDKSKAEKLFDFFNNRISTELDYGTGGFAQFRDATGNPTGNKWLGDNCWLLIALHNYSVKYNSTKYNTMQEHLTIWIKSLQNQNGSLNAGYESNLITLQVTEGMIDAYNAVTGYDAFHSKLLTFLKQERWEANQHYLLSWPNNYYVYALDNFSWGYCAFENFPVTVLQNTLFTTTKLASNTNNYVSGFCFDIDKDTVWLEGTGEMVVAFQKAGMTTQANYYLNEMEKTLVTSTAFPNAKGMPYVTNSGSGYGSGTLWGTADSLPCVSSSAWYLFGVLHFDPMAIGYQKNCPQSDQFWLN